MIGSRLRRAARDPARPSPGRCWAPAGTGSCADHLLQRVAGQPGERRVHPDQRDVRTARVGDRERHLGRDHRSVAQHRQASLVAERGARQVQEDHQRERGEAAAVHRGVEGGPVHLRAVQLGAVEAGPGPAGRPVGEVEARHPQQPAVDGGRAAVGSAAVPGRLTHRHRLPRHRHPGGDHRQRRGGVAQGLAAEVGQARGVAPRVDVDGQPDPLAGELDGRGVRVDDLPPVQVDQQDGRRRAVQHVGQVGGGQGAAGGDVQRGRRRAAPIPAPGQRNARPAGSAPRRPGTSPRR